MINHQWPDITTYNTLHDIALDLAKTLVGDAPTIFTATNLVTVTGSALATPAIQTVFLLVVWREKLGSARLRLPAPSAG
jgi:hypothetical protein